MKKISLLFFYFIINHGLLMAQPEKSDKPEFSVKSHEILINIFTPISGYLKHISNIGVGAAYSWTKESSGKMASLPSKPLGFTFNIGIDYFIGENEKYLNQTIKYGGTTYLHTYGGAVYILGKMSNIKLSTGPNLEIYKSATAFGFGAIFSGSFYLFKNDKFGLSPNFSVMKQEKSEVVLAAGAGVNLHFKKPGNLL